MNVAIHTEVGQLKRVLVHQPGDEIVRMTQHNFSTLLFDDLVSPLETVREHQLMVEIMRTAGAEVLDVQQLLEQALELASADLRAQLLRDVCEVAGIDDLTSSLIDWAPSDLANALIGGVYWHALEHAPPSLSRIRASLHESQDMALPPLPNMAFVRDPAMAVYGSIILGRMATDARAREPLLAAFALQHSGLLQNGLLQNGLEQAGMLFTDDDRHRHPSFRSLEGGDLLVISPELLLIGCSQRTSAQTIERLCSEALFPSFPKLQRVFAVLIPDARSVMHLDTILTQIDHRLFLGHAPYIVGPAAGGSARSTSKAALPVVQLERDKAPALVPKASVFDVLRNELGKDTQLVPCGGDDPLHQEREQWTDGANAVCLAPGRIILYARNRHTIAALLPHGFEEVRISVAQPAAQRQELIRAGMARERTVLSFSGSELSRARGGGRCLTMPLCRATENA